MSARQSQTTNNSFRVETSNPGTRLVPKTNGSDLFSSGGEMARLTREFDWSRTPLGPIEHWPQSLRTTVRVLLTSRFAMWMSWGPELTFLYNDAYAAMTLGKKHPWALGRRSQDVWAEIWKDIGPRIEKVLQTGEATWDEALLLFLERSGYREETYHTFSYSPLSDDDGRVAGHLCVVSEETDRVIGDRRLKTLRSLAAELAKSITEEDVYASVDRALAQNDQDLPFAMTYIFAKDAKGARLASRSGIPEGHPGAPKLIDFAEPSQLWPLAEMLARKEPIILDSLPERVGTVPSGFWDKAPERAILVPISSQTQEFPAGVLVVGLNPYRQLDASYSGFLTLIAGQIAASIANARAYENERKRAEALAELDKAKTTFFSNISHELRTPLTLLLGPTEAAISTPNGALSGEELAMVHRNELRLLKLVNTLLDFSRIEAGRVEASFAPTDLATFTADLASVFRSAVERAGLQLKVDCPSLPQPVYVDRDMWEKIVFNLISNAFKSTFEGEISVSIRASEGSVELVVRDTGTGIAADQIPHLFERFRRIEGAKRRSHEGSGIGLALVHELVKFHSGSIQVESELGKGSTFKVTLPFGTAHLPPERISTNENEPKPTRSAYVAEALSWLGDGSAGKLTDFQDDLIEAPRSTTSNTSARILLAEDNRDMRDYVRRLLGGRYEVITAQNGKVALEYARKSPPDLVLTDIMMPEMDGFQLLAALRELPETSTTPVILLSARAGEESRVEGVERGADDYLVKPFSARELLARIDTHLALAGLRKKALQTVRASEEELRILNQVGATLASELDRKRLVQTITDAGRELSGAEFGAFFYNLVDDSGEKYMLYTLSGASQEAFSKFPMPRNTAIFGPTFAGEGTVRLHDVTKDPRYGKNAPYHGMPPGHLPVRSYLAVPVISRSGTVLGGLFYGHQTPGIFTERAERLVEGLARQAAIAIDNSNLFEAATRQKAQLQESEERLRAIVETTPECVKLVAQDGTLLYMNSSGLKMLRAGQANELVGKSVLQLIAQEHRDRFREFHERICAGETGALEFDVIALDGERHHMETHAAPLRNPDGSIVHLGVTRDVTERKQAESAKGRLAAIVESSDDAIVSKNLDAVIQTWNKGAENLFGYSAAEAIGQHITLIIPPERWSEEDVIIGKIRRGERVDHFETVRRRKDGTLVEVSLTISPVRDSSGRIIGASKIARDITERRKAERALREQEERLRKTEKLAAAGQLAASLAHEINNPLSSVTNALYLLSLNSTLDAATQDVVRIARTEVARTSRIVKQSLSYYRTDAVAKEVDLAALVDESLQVFGAKLQRAGIQVKLKLKRGTHILGFPDEIRQVLDNVLLNAIEAMPKGGRLGLAVHYSRNWGNGFREGVRLVIADSGSGISKEIRTKIFEPFFTTKAEKGTGLGLWVVRGIVAKHDGAIAVRSSVRKDASGTAISIFFPFGTRLQRWNITAQSSASD
jgi:PAS domain S-box-containing protein